MGCFSSGPIHPNRVRSNNHAINFPEDFDEEEEKYRKPPELTLEEKQMRDFAAILDGISSVPTLVDLNPVVPTTSKAFPILLADFTWDEIQQSNLQLPVIVLANSDIGKYIVFGSSEIIFHKMILKTEISALLENVGMWASDFRLKSIRVIIHGFSNHFQTVLASDLASFGYTAESFLTLPEKLNYDFMFVPSYIGDPKVHERILAYSQNGGTVFVFAQDNPKEPGTVYNIAPLLKKAGIGLPVSHLNAISPFLQTQPYDVMKTKTIDFLVNEFFTLLDSEPLELEKIDNSVAILRYYVSCLGHEQGELAAEINDKCWNFLLRTEYVKDGLYCPELTQSILAVLISDIMPLIPPHLVKEAPPAADFPGECGSVHLDKRKMRLKVSKTGMFSTGLYLPPAKVGTIESNIPFIVQIGSHDECLLTKTGKWKRWPVVSMMFKADAGKTQIASPFGGIVYVSADETNNLIATFDGFCKYPRFVLRECTWNNTEDLPVPWGEVELSFLTITLPTDVLVAISENIADEMTRLDLILADAYAFLGIKDGFCRRLVFDVDLATDGPVIGDVCILNLKTLPDAVITSKYSDALMQTVTFIVMSSFPEAILDNDAMLALASVGASKSLAKQYPEEMEAKIAETLKSTADASVIFSQMWSLTLDKPSEFSAAVGHFLSQKYTEDTPLVEKWDQLMHFMYTARQETRASRTNLPLLKLNDRFKQTDMLNATSSDLLIKYQIVSVSNSKDKIIEEEK